MDSEPNTQPVATPAAALSDLLAEALAIIDISTLSERPDDEQGTTSQWAQWDKDIAIYEERVASWRMKVQMVLANR